ncbi:C-C motif chemokine 3-like [Silurus meridionalis]|nr:C-C motif chemokine 3-like [Silurus meridionalis]
MAASREVRAWEPEVRPTKPEFPPQFIIIIIININNFFLSFHCSAYFVVLKKNGRLLPILDLLYFNRSLRWLRFRMLTLKVVMSQVNSKDWFVLTSLPIPGPPVWPGTLTLHLHKVSAAVIIIIIIINITSLITLSISSHVLFFFPDGFAGSRLLSVLHDGSDLTTKKGFRKCADPEVDWVKQIINQTEINEKIMKSSVTDASGADLCCFEFHKRPIPAANIISVEETRFDCTLPGVIFTPKKGFRMCLDPEVDWVKTIIEIKIRHGGSDFTTKKTFRMCADPEVDWVKQIIESKIEPSELTQTTQ